jgi:glutaconate CoA-transferase subunit A
MDVLERGSGPVFTDPDPDAARAFFREKSRVKTDKTMSLKRAVETFVHDGDYLGIGGFGANRTPVAACHEIVRQGKKEMGFAGHTATHDMQILSAGKVYNRIDVAYVVGLEARGLSATSRKYLESRAVQVSEWTNYALSVRLQAAAMGVPYLPMRGMLGTDTFEKSGAVAAPCPFTGKKMTLVPALGPDVAFIHVHEADIYGNARFEGIAVADLELAGASRHVVITCERLVPHDEITRAPHKTQIPYFIVDAVCEVPFGAYPGTMPNEYFSDEAHLREWMTVEKNPDTLAEFLDRQIYGCPDFQAYIDINGGVEKMARLRRQEFMIKTEEG